MTACSDESIRKVTSALSAELQHEQLTRDEVVYKAMPHADERTPFWRIRLELAFDSSIRMGLDINDEILIGRGGDEPGHVTLFSAIDTEQLGVSRRHAKLRPTETGLFLIDLGSTNGTFQNGRKLGANTPYNISNGDHIKLGRLEMVVRIIKRPGNMTGLLQKKAELTEIVTAAACNIMSQLNVEDVMKQSMNTIMNYIPADEITLWLIDEKTGELFLEAGRGTDSEHIARLPVSDTLAGQVIETGKPMRVNRTPHGEQIRLKTGYLVEAVIYVPLHLGGVTFGVLSVANQVQGKAFSEHDEKLLMSIADFTAVAVHNARVHSAANRLMARRGKVLMALRYALSQGFKSALQSTIGHCSLLSADPSLSEEATEAAANILASANQVSGLMDRLIEPITLVEQLDVNSSPCDLVEIVQQAMQSLSEMAAERPVQLEGSIFGEPYMIQGDASHLLWSVYSLLENAIRFTRKNTKVSVTIIFSPEGPSVRVADTGPGLPMAFTTQLYDGLLDSTPSPDGHVGLGLGLEIARTTAEAHGGRLDARNLEGGGAEFLICLPASVRVA